jgi:hypothetical protein
MNATRRGLNRTLLFLVALVLLAAGALLLAVGIVPGFADAWVTTGQGVQSWLQDIGKESAGWGAVAALAVIAVLLIVLAASAVRGRHSTALQSTGSDNTEGRITLTDGFASNALTNALADRDEILTSRINAGDINGQPVLHIALTPRQNTSPRQVTEHVDTLVTNLATLTGQTFRTYISIHTGLRAKLAHDNTRVH